MEQQSIFARCNTACQVEFLQMQTIPQQHLLTVLLDGYHVFDLATEYKFKNYNLKAGSIMYLTSSIQPRASGYPGPEFTW
jgi:ABC-type phosphate/phosphonate transport system ATPase subunit